MMGARAVNDMNSSFAPSIADKLAARSAVAGIIGLGYIGLPLAVAAARAGFRTIGFDVDRQKVDQINAGVSYVDAVTSPELGGQVSSGRFRASAAFEELGICDVIVICVPTPLNRHREPDMHYVVATAETIERHLRAGQLIVLESTTYPGTTEEVLKPLLERGGLISGKDFYLGYSPEREDPGNQDFGTATIPKVVSGDGPMASVLVEAFYGSVVDRIVPVSSPTVAEAVKITENVFRAVNIALANELKLIYDAMGIDVWEVIDAAATKPFGFMPFYPGPGLGGHCIPIDPFYLTWRSREYGLSTRFIELAGEINLAMPRRVVARVEEALDRHLSLSLSVARVLVVGIAYKKNVPDTRESPALVLIELLERRGVHVDYHDPHVAEILPTHGHEYFAGRRSVAVTPETAQAYSCVLICTDHDEVDYGLLASHARLIVDTRNAMARRGLSTANVVKA